MTSHERDGADTGARVRRLIDQRVHLGRPSARRVPLVRFRLGSSVT